MPTREDIEKLAYYLWEKEGKPEGRDQYYYYEAERQLKERESLELTEPSRQAPIRPPAPELAHPAGRSTAAPRATSTPRPRRRTNTTR